MNQFESLEEPLDAHFDKPLSELPSAVRVRVEKDFLPWPWDKMNVDQRRSRAQTWDFENSPFNKEEREGINALTNPESPSYSKAETKRLRGDFVDEVDSSVKNSPDLPNLEWVNQPTFKLKLRINTLDLPDGFGDDSALAGKPTAPADGDSKPDPERRLALLRELGGTARRSNLDWTFKGVKKLVASEKDNGRKRASEKTIRADLKEAAQNELDVRRAGFGTGLGQR